MTTEYTVYAFVNRENGDTYVGSTKNLNKRLTKHFSNYKNGDQSKLYRMIDNSPNGWNDIDIEELESMTGNVEDARMREEYYRITLEANMNSNKCILTPEQRVEISRAYYWEHKEAVLIKKRDFYKANADELNKKSLERYNRLKTDINFIQKRRVNGLKSYYKNRQKRIDRIKKYYADNRDSILEKSRQRYLKNKNK